MTTEGVVSVDYLVQHLLGAKERKVEAGELQKRTWVEYERVGKFLIKVFGAPGR